MMNWIGKILGLGDKPGGGKGIQTCEFDHIAINVPNMDEAVGFFACIVGAEEILRTGEFVADEQMVRQFGVPPGTLVKDHRVLAVGRDTKLSLFQYHHPEIDWRIPGASDLGGYHVAFRVHDIDSAVAHLAAHNVTLAGPILNFTMEPLRGYSSAYFYSPWGMQIEFVQYPRD